MNEIKFTRRDYGKHKLQNEHLASHPFSQFKTWLKEAIEKECADPSAMVLATIDNQGTPDTRVVLLKKLTRQNFIFFTHYTSPKAIQAEKSGTVGVNFYWPKLSKQIRIKGKIKRTARQISTHYFASRPRESQIITFVSMQSRVITTRHDLEKQVEEIKKRYRGKKIPCPKNWGGYHITPFEFEFFQGRTHRFNDRIRYRRLNHHWKIERLSP